MLSGSYGNMNDRRNGIVQFIKFGIVGLSNTMVSYLVYMLCYFVLKTNVHIANLFGFIVSVLNAYLWQNIFVFKQEAGKEKRVWWKVLLKTYASYAFTGLLLAELLLILWLNVIDISRFMQPVCDLLAKLNIVITPKALAVSAAPILNLVITVPLNFIINRFWAYKQK